MPYNIEIKEAEDRILNAACENVYLMNKRGSRLPRKFFEENLRLIIRRELLNCRLDEARFHGDVPRILELQTRLNGVNEAIEISKSNDPR